MPTKEPQSHRKAARKPVEEEEINRQAMDYDLDHPEWVMFQDQPGLELLHDQVGNLTVQQVLAQEGGLTAGPGRAAAPAQVQRRPDAEDEDRPAGVETELATAGETTETGEGPVAGEAAQAEAEAADAEKAAANENETPAGEPLEVGQIEIEKPEIESYQITANTLDEAIAEIKDPDDWFEYIYEYETKSENDRVVEANIKIAVTIHLPEWVGSGWEGASPQEQARWGSMLEAFQLYDEKYAEPTELPPNVLLGPAWEKAPAALKTDWRSTLQSIQKEEAGHLDIARRRAIVLQQRLLNQPEQESNSIFDQFLKDMEAEEEEYIRQRDVGEPAPVSVGGNVIVQ